MAGKVSPGGLEKNALFKCNTIFLLGVYFPTHIYKYRVIISSCKTMQSVQLRETTALSSFFFHLCDPESTNLIKLEKSDPICSAAIQTLIRSNNAYPFPDQALEPKQNSLW